MATLSFPVVSPQHLKAALSILQPSSAFPAPKRKSDPDYYEGGIDGLRAQLVAALQGVGASVTSTLEGASRSLYFTVESRRMDMEEKEKGDSKE